MTNESIVCVDNYDPENDLGLLKTNIPPFWRLNILNRLIDRGFMSNEDAKTSFERIRLDLDKSNGKAGEMNE